MWACPYQWLLESMKLAFSVGPRCPPGILLRRRLSVTGRTQGTRYREHHLPLITSGLIEPLVEIGIVPTSHPAFRRVAMSAVRVRPCDSPARIREEAA